MNDENKTINRYETENGILAEESAQIERVEDGDDVLRTVGFYLFIGDDGKVYSIIYDFPFSSPPTVSLNLSRNIESIILQTKMVS